VVFRKIFSIAAVIDAMDRMKDRDFYQSTLFQ
jgi:hypothetical protein